MTFIPGPFSTVVDSEIQHVLFFLFFLKYLILVDKTSRSVSSCAWIFFLFIQECILNLQMVNMLPDCYFLPCCFIWTKGFWGLRSPFQLPSHRQDLTFGRQELLEAAGDSWSLRTEGNVIYVLNTSRCSDSAHAPQEVQLLEIRVGCWLFSMTLLHNSLAVCKWFSKAVT